MLPLFTDIQPVHWQYTHTSSAPTMGCSGVTYHFVWLAVAPLLGVLFVGRFMFVLAVSMLAANIYTLFVRVWKGNMLKNGLRLAPLLDDKLLAVRFPLPQMNDVKWMRQRIQPCLLLTLWTSFCFVSNQTKEMCPKIMKKKTKIITYHLYINSSVSPAADASRFGTRIGPRRLWWPIRFSNANCSGTGIRLCTVDRRYTHACRQSIVPDCGRRALAAPTTPVSRLELEQVWNAARQLGNSLARTPHSKMLAVDTAEIDNIWQMLNKLE